MKKQLPPFDVHSKLHYWLSYKYSDEITITFSITGNLDIDTLKKSAQEVYQATPILQTKIKERWIFVTRAIEPSFLNIDFNSLFSIDLEPKNNPGNIDGFHEESTIDFLNTPIDFLNHPPIKFCVTKKNDSETLFFIKVHHSVCDGFGVYLIASKIFQKYNEHKGQANTISLPEEPKNYSMFTLKKLLHKKQNHKQERTKKCSFFRDSIATDGIFKNHPLILTNDEFTLIKNVSKKSELSFNDILLTVVCRSIYRILKMRDLPTDYLRFVQTANLRKHMNIEGGISNISSIYYANFSNEDLVDITTALKASLREKKRTLELQESIRHVFSLSIFKLIPSKLARKLIASNDKKSTITQPQLTALVANNGDVSNIIELPKDCTISYMWPFTPVHFSYGMQWFFLSIHKVLTINIVYFDPVISEETVRTLLTNFKEELHSLGDITWTS